VYREMHGDVLVDARDGLGYVDVMHIELRHLLVADSVLTLKPLHPICERVHRHQQLSDDLLIYLPSHTGVGFYLSTGKATPGLPAGGVSVARQRKQSCGPEAARPHRRINLT
jgi:hypothetical protein